MATSTGFRAAPGLVRTSDRNTCEAANGLFISTGGMSKIKTLYGLSLSVLRSDHVTRRARSHISTCHYLLSNIWTLTAERFSLSCHAVLCKTPGKAPEVGLVKDIFCSPQKKNVQVITVDLGTWVLSTGPG